MMSLLPVADARQRILENATAIVDSEWVPLQHAYGRRLSHDIVAKRAQPPFSASAMDGYAVQADDLIVIPKHLRIIGEAPAGHGFNGTVRAGEAVRIFTGAPLPQGADTIVIQEDTERLSATEVNIVATATRGNYVRPEGLDFAVGDIVLQQGQRLDAGRITVAAAMNCPTLPVVRRPRIGILATGDELVAPGGDPGYDQIIASNSYGIRAIVEADNAQVIDLGIAIDRQDVIEAAIEQAVADKVDILVTLGGASVGDHDLVQSALVARGMELDFWRIAMRPGKPLMYGQLNELQVLGLPGNPVSSLVCTHLFLRPLIARLSGLQEKSFTNPAILGTSVPANDRRQDYLRARLQRNAQGELIASAYTHQDSSMTRTFADSDCLIIRPPHAKESAAGSPCTIHMLREPE